MQAFYFCLFVCFCHQSTQLQSWSLIEWVFTPRSSNGTANTLTTLPHCLYNNGLPPFVTGLYFYYLNEVSTLVTCCHSIFSRLWDLPAFCLSPQYRAAFEPCSTLLRDIPTHGCLPAEGYPLWWPHIPHSAQASHLHMWADCLHTLLSPPSTSTIWPSISEHMFTLPWAQPFLPLSSIYRLSLKKTNDPLHHSSNDLRQL